MVKNNFTTFLTISRTQHIKNSGGVTKVFYWYLHKTTNLSHTIRLHSSLSFYYLRNKAIKYRENLFVWYI